MQQRVLRTLGDGNVLEVGDGSFVEKTVVHGVHGQPNDIAVSFEWSPRTPPTSPKVIPARNTATTH